MVEEHLEAHHTALHAHDVVMLAFMLHDALTCIHEYTKSLHLQIQPCNVFLEASASENEELVIGHGPKSIRLANDVFGPGRLPLSLAGKVTAGTKWPYTAMHGLLFCLRIA
jgi:hypothetical protein